MTNLYLRQAEKDDAELILNWRNDKLSREHSFDKSIIDHDSHMIWYENRLNDPECRMYMLMRGADNVGHIRLDIRDGVGKISYMIAPSERGKGYGTAIIRLCEDMVSEDLDMLLGLVENDNEASLKCFRKNGYSESEADGTFRFTKAL